MTGTWTSVRSPSKKKNFREEQRYLESGELEGSRLISMSQRRGVCRMTRGEDSYVPSGSRATFVGRVTLTSVTNERDTKT